ncbi:MAG: IPTL-CTERM sorting domain-containing protein [Gammaproteobacteria bacterium]|nr:IPTL-CTERM sorting domain-containing protein [Gammaproteobacteria bacterium]
MQEATADFTLTALAAPVTAQPIPTLGEWAMLLMAGLLGVLGAGALHRQKNQKFKAI